MNRRQLAFVAGAVLLAVAALALKCGEDPPTVPTITPPEGTVYQNAEVAIRVVATQPQEKNLKYVVNWGDGVTDTSAIDYPSGTEATLRHVWTEPGGYEVKALAFVEDNTELASDWSAPVTVTIEANEAPTDVRIRDYPFQVGRNRWAFFEVSATDPEGDSIQYQFDFGGSSGSWTTPLVPSGTPVQDSFRFRSLGEFQVKARARDHKGSMSEWSDSVMVKVDTTGVVNWAWMSPDDDEGPAIGSPLIQTRNEEEVVYVGAEDEFGRAYGIKVSTGRHTVRSGSADEDYFTGHPTYVAATGNIIFGNENGEIYAFDKSLSRKWNWPDSARGGWPTYLEWGVFAVNGSKIYGTRDDDRVYCVTDLGVSGRYEASRSIPSIHGNPVINGAGQVVVITDQGRIVYLDGNNLNVAWDTVLTAGGAALNALAVGSAGHVYVGDAGGNVYCINPDRSIGWKVQVDGEANGIVIGSGAVYVATGRGKIYRLNPNSPTPPVWVSTLVNADEIETTPILTANGLIYIHDDMDVLHCIKQDDGAYVWRVDCAEFTMAQYPGRARRARDFEMPMFSPALAGNGDIIVVGLDALYCVSGYTEGTLAQTAWPKWQGGRDNTGKAGSF